MKRVAKLSRNSGCLVLAAMVMLTVGCVEEEKPFSEDWTVHGEFAPGLYAPLGEVIPTATPEQKAIFEEGEAVSLHRFAPSEGLGPAFNVTFCTSCHEKCRHHGVPGCTGISRLRNDLDDGSFVPAASAGDAAV